MSITAFLTDSTLCIGCKACEVACKEWNGVPEDGLTWSGFSYDNTGALGHSSWRHVKFIESGVETGHAPSPPFDGDNRGPLESGGSTGLRSAAGLLDNGVSTGLRSDADPLESGGSTGLQSGDPSAEDLGALAPAGPLPGFGGNAPEFPTWTFSSDVCKHCEVAGCLEACPTGAIVRTEFGGVFIQPDVCNGCAYCVVACPFGVVQKNPDDGRAFKCTFCYDRQKVGLGPACAKACPTESIKFADINEIQLIAQERLKELHGRGMHDAQLYNPSDSSVGGVHSMFIVRGDPRSYNLPPRPEVPTIYNRAGWKASVIGGAAMLAVALLAFLGDKR